MVVFQNVLFDSAQNWRLRNKHENEHTSFEKFDNFHSGEEFVKLEKLVQSALDMDTLGIKDKVWSSALLKNFKKPESEWAPLEKEIDASMVVTLHPTTKDCPQHYSCAIPWKNEVPCLANKKGSCLDEINKNLRTKSEKAMLKKSLTQRTWIEKTAFMSTTSQ